MNTITLECVLVSLITVEHLPSYLNNAYFDYLPSDLNIACVNVVLFEYQLIGIPLFLLAIPFLSSAFFECCMICISF